MAAMVMPAWLLLCWLQVQPAASADRPERQAARIASAVVQGRSAGRRSVSGGMRQRDAQTV